jgi:NSS family neurotransmitter:Na+ symporter
MDAVSIYIIPIGALISAVLLFLGHGQRLCPLEMGKGRASRPGQWVTYLGKYVFCLVTLAVIILGIAKGGI